MRLTIDVAEGEQICIMRMKDEPQKKQKRYVSLDDIFPEPTEEEQQERMNAIADDIDAKLNRIRKLENARLAAKPSYISKELYEAFDNR